MTDRTEHPTLPKNQRLHFGAATGTFAFSPKYNDISLWLTVEDKEGKTSIHGEFYGNLVKGMDPHVPFDVVIFATDPFTLRRWHFKILGAEITEPHKFIARTIINWR